MATKGKSKAKGPKPQDDLIGWAWTWVMGGSKKSGNKTSKSKGPKFSEDAVGWLIKRLVGK